MHARTGSRPGGGGKQRSDANALWRSSTRQRRNVGNRAAPCGGRVRPHVQLYSLYPGKVNF